MDDLPSGKRILELASLAIGIQERAADNSGTKGTLPRHTIKWKRFRSQRVRNAAWIET